MGYSILYKTFFLREYSIDILDKMFSPIRLSIEEGDKVWFQWSSKKVAFFHSSFLNEILIC